MTPFGVAFTTLAMAATGEVIRELARAEIVQVARLTQVLWGDGAELDAYTHFLAEQLDRSAGRARLMGICRGGEVLASLKRYRLSLAVGPRAVRAVGIGAVFTHPRERGRGLAVRLLHRVLQRAQQQGVHAALLFSDIEPTFYRRMGFVQLPAFTWSAPTEPLPRAQPLSWTAISDVAQLNHLRRRGTRSDELMITRDAQDWRYWRWRNQAQRTLLLQDDTQALGYVCCHHEGEQLWIDELVTAPIERDRVHATLRALATQHGAFTVAGWLRPEHARGAFMATARQRCIPMLAWLCDPPIAMAAARFAALDVF